MKFLFSNKLQEEQVNGELECLVLASDGLWDVVENEVITLPQFSHSQSRQLLFT
jgi:protein phosphatase 1L